MWSELEPELRRDWERRHPDRPWDRAAEPIRHAWAASEDSAGRLELREEDLVARKEVRKAGEVAIRTEMEQVPSKLETEAFREEVRLRHVPVNQVVSERVPPWEEDGAFVVPVYVLLPLKVWVPVPILVKIIAALSSWRLPEKVPEPLLTPRVFTL